MHEAAQNINWKGLVEIATPFFKRYAWAMGLGAAFVATAFLISILASPATRFMAFGGHLGYSTDWPAKKYLIEFQTSVNLFSERQKRLDTPLEQFQVDNIGNVLTEKQEKRSSDKRIHIDITPQEWIEIKRRGDHSESQTLPLTNPTLTKIAVILDHRGMVVQRSAAFSPRLAKSLYFLMPRFPRGSVPRQSTWTEPVQWMDQIDEWKILWTGTLHWTMVGLTDCGSDTCEQLEYQADLKPSLAGAPSWAAGAIQRIYFRGTTSGLVLFNSHRDSLSSNSFHYAGFLRMPISDLGRIPRALRVGRRVQGPGDIVLDFKSRIEIHEP
jgi:hypothetical protein